MDAQNQQEFLLLAQEFLLTMRASRYSSQTVDKYEAILNLFVHFLDGGHCTLNQISEATILKYFAELTCGKKTALNYHTTLSAFWRWCVKNGYAKENIVRKAVQIRPPSPSEILPFNRDEVASMLNAAGDGNTPKRDMAMLLLLLDTGIRAGELCSLVLSDMFWVTRRILIRHGKGDKERVIKFSEPTYDAMIAYLDSRGIVERKGTIPLFSTKYKKPFNIGRVRKIIDKVSRDSGVVDAHAHRFRHTFAVEFLRNGGNIYTLQKLLGHTTLEMCKRYLALSQIDLDRDIDKASPVKNWFGK
jgi:site-specific recombinase XerD